VAKQLGSVIHQLQRSVTLLEENQSLREQLGLESELVGESAGIKDVETQIARVAGTNATCLIRGESGSGKELVARAIHYNSQRKDGPFVCLNCAALTETLLESELFGHEKGSFTGATEKKIGKFEAANHGTIFLDEIGEMNVGTQAKLLRILEGHPFERVGGNTSIRADVRVVAATNQPLEEAIHEGRFRPDLFFRLQVVEIRVPPLRKRKSDVPLLADHFLKRFVRGTGRKVRGFTQAALKKMEEYHWPGNVRELRNVVERAVALGTRPCLDAIDVWLSAPDAQRPEPGDGMSPTLLFPLVKVEEMCIQQVLEHTDWNKSEAAALLQIERSTLDRKIKLYGLKRGGSAKPVSTTAPAPDQEWDPDKEKARIDLTHYGCVLDRHGWDIGKASEKLFPNRYQLSRKVKKLFQQFPELRHEFTTLAAAFSREGDSSTSSRKR
jgi:Nif-specific regulatory protein